MYNACCESSYVSIETLGKMRDFFPDLGAETLEAGHWVHAEKFAFLSG